MPVASPGSIGVEAQRAELNAVLQSRSFLRAPTLASFLAYLCEKLFAGEASQIKEYSIALEVFRRASSFDQDSDSIVRVEANRLRKRLAEYYAGEGAAHALHITIPIGQYVPEFELRSEPIMPVAADTVANQHALTEENATVESPTASPAASFEQPADRPLRVSPGRWRLGALAFLLFMLAAIVFGIAYLRSGQSFFGRPQSSQSSTDAGAHAPLPFTSDPEVGPPAGDEIRILAGSTRSFVDHAGKLWNTDAGFTGGSAVKSDVQHIWRTLEPEFYRSSRQGDFRYDIPLKPGIYELRLHFAETVYGPESTGTGGEGDRILSVRANGAPLLNRFDIAADAGASRTADVKVFPNISPAADGILHLAFSGEDGKQASLSAIEILPGVRGHIRPVRVLARQSPYYSNDSHWWSPDNYFEGGQIASYTAPVNGTDDPDLYKSERWGNFSYAIPAPPGKYTVWLHFAARHGESDQSPAAAEDKRPATAHVFNVFCNGKVLLQNFDLAAEARKSDIVVRKAAGLEPNAQGKLFLSFVPVEGYATVAGIEVLPQELTASAAKK